MKYLEDKQRILMRISINKKSGCWNWKGAGSRNEDKLKRYGHLTIGLTKDKTRKTVSAHRFSYITFIGPVPIGLWVLHKCENPKCVNPKHLFLGTRQDNVDDREAKGRNNFIHYSGEKNPGAKLTLSEVKDIRKSKDSNSILSKRFCICRSQVSAIKRFISWKDA